MTNDLLTRADAEPEIPVDDEPEIPLDEPEIPLEPEPDAPEPPAAVATLALMQVLPADFPLPLLTRFVPNPGLKQALDGVTAYAMAIDIAGNGPVALAKADVALVAVRNSLRAIEEDFEEPTDIAHKLHKRLTGLRSEWTAEGEAAVKTIGRRIWLEQERLKAIAAEQRRKDQAEADRQAREVAKREAEAAAKAQAPATVVREMERQARTATAPPVATPASAVPVMQGSTTVTTWKARIAGTPACDDPTPSIEDLTPAQREMVNALLQAIVDGKAPIAAVSLNWSYLQKRAKADKSTLAICGIEAYEDGGVRSKGSRSR